MMLHPLPTSMGRRALKLLPAPKFVGTVWGLSFLAYLLIWFLISLFLGLFLKLPLSHYVFFLHSFSTHACSSRWAVLVWQLTCCNQHGQGSAGMRHYRYRESSGKAGFLQAGKMCFPAAICKKTFF